MSKWHVLVPNGSVMLTVTSLVPLKVITTCVVSGTSRPVERKFDVSSRIMVPDCGHFWPALAFGSTRLVVVCTTVELIGTDAPLTSKLPLNVVVDTPFRVCLSVRIPLNVMSELPSIVNGPPVENCDCEVGVPFTVIFVSI